MGQTGTVNDSAQAIMRRFVAQRDQDTRVLRSTVQGTRKATRSRGSSIVHRTVTPLPRSEWAVATRYMIHDDAERWGTTADWESHHTGGTVVRPGGRTTLTDYHK